jgi:zinc protease
MIKPTRFRKDEVLVKVRLGHGRIDLPKDRATLAWATPALVLGGLGKISFEDMKSALADRAFGISAAFGDEAFELSGATRPQDLKTQFEVLAAFMSDPAYRPEAFERIKNALAIQIASLSATPQGVFARDAGVLEHGGDLRWATPSLEEVRGARLADLRALLDPILSGDGIEVDVAGDVDVEATIAAAGAVFGSLPPRATRPARPGGLEVKGPPTGGAIVHLAHTGRADQAVAFQAWPTAGFFADPQGARATNVAAEVLQLRLIDEVRVHEGATYSPSAASYPSIAFPTFGFVAASVEIPPGRIDGFFRTVDALAASLATKGPTADEMERAVRPKVETLLKAQQTNEYWLEWIADADRDPKGLEVVRTTIPGYRRLSADDVRAAAARAFGQGVFRIEVTAAAP